MIHLRHSSSRGRHLVRECRHCLRLLSSLVAGWNCRIDRRRSRGRSGGEGVWKRDRRSSSGSPRSCFHISLRYVLSSLSLSIDLQRRQQRLARSSRHSVCSKSSIMRILYINQSKISPSSFLQSIQVACGQGMGGLDGDQQRESFE